MYCQFMAVWHQFYFFSDLFIGRKPVKLSQLFDYGQKQQIIASHYKW